MNAKEAKRIQAEANSAQDIPGHKVRIVGAADGYLEGCRQGRIEGQREMRKGEWRIEK